MGAAPSSAANASCAQLCADGAEPQELCAVTPCEWDRGGACQSTMTGCECPQYKAGLATSALPPFLEDPVGAMIIACGPLLLVTLTIAVVPLMLCTPWQRTSALPRSLSAVTPATLCAWILLCALVTLGLMTAEHVLPPTVWGECAQRVCVYHMMFCEATRHGSAVRHPANFWSNLPYAYTALGLLCLAVEENVHRSTRPFQLLDATFGLVLLAMSFASFAWHASNCTAVHMIDIGLMNAVIAFFPFRFTASALLALAGSSDARGSLAVGIAYVALAAALLGSSYAHTDEFHSGFPTGRARAAVTPRTISALEISMYCGLPGLYPLPALLLMAWRRHWGCMPAIGISVIALPAGFVMHILERLVLDLRCEPLSLLTQPTACFHVGTGVAIFAAAIQARTLDECGARPPKRSSA